MSEFVDPSEYGLWVTVAADESGSGERMKIPSSDVDAVLDALRTAAVNRTTYALNVALLKWQAHETEVPGLIDRDAVGRVLLMVDSAADALRVLYELAGEIVDDDDSDGEPAPEPDPAGTKSA